MGQVYLLPILTKRWCDFFKYGKTPRGDTQGTKPNLVYTHKELFKLINNGNRTEWSPNRSVSIREINKIKRPRSGSSDLLITSMTED